MSDAVWDEIRSLMNEHGYMHEVERTAERVQATGEVFTPTDLVLEMLQRIPLDMLAPGKTVLDPACGDGQFLVAAKWVKVLHFGMTEEEALTEIYGVDIMADNVELCRKRLGGGTVVVGDAMCADRAVEGQTSTDLQLMASLFGPESQQESLFG